MVYESDFYTSRRPYRPVVSSYTVTEPRRIFVTPREYDNAKREIRVSTARLLRQIHEPALLRAVSPFKLSRPEKIEPTTSEEAPADPNFKKWVYDPFKFRTESEVYVANNVVNPVRNVAKNIETMSHYHSPAHRYVGKNHLASTRIIGDKAYPKTKPRIYNYDTSAKVKKDVNVLSYYRKNQTKAEADVEEVSKKERKSKLGDKTGVYSSDINLAY